MSMLGGTGRGGSGGGGELPDRAAGACSVTRLEKSQAVPYSESDRGLGSSTCQQVEYG